jgi:bacterial/archaeal transporter family protein
MEYSWLVYALLSAIFAALVAIFAKIGLKEVDANTATMIRAFIMFVFLFIVVSFQGKLGLISGFFSDKKIVYFIILSGIAGALSWLFYFLALKKGSVIKVVSIDRLSIVFATVFALVFLNEKLSFKNAMGVLLIVVGAIVIAFED